MSGSGENIATKSKWKSPDKFFPIIVDNFFEDPLSVRWMGQQVPKETVGNQPGLRSKQFWEIDQILHNAIIKKALGCYFDLDYVNLTWKLSNMNFHEMSAEDGKGWIHQDNIVQNAGADNELAGLIYLTPIISYNSGTSLFTLKDGAVVRPEEETKQAGWQEHRDKFNEKFRFENVFNRLIMYDAKEWHAATEYVDNRLTLAFFIGGIEGVEFPRQRISREDNIIEARIGKSSQLNQQNRIYSNVK